MNSKIKTMTKEIAQADKIKIESLIFDFDMKTNFRTENMDMYELEEILCLENKIKRINIYLLSN